MKGSNSKNRKGKNFAPQTYLFYHSPSIHVHIFFFHFHPNTLSIFIHLKKNHPHHLVKVVKSILKRLYFFHLFY